VDLWSSNGALLPSGALADEMSNMCMEQRGHGFLRHEIGLLGAGLRLRAGRSAQGKMDTGHWCAAVTSIQYDTDGMIMLLS